MHMYYLLSVENYCSKLQSYKKKIRKLCVIKMQAVLELKFKYPEILLSHYAKGWRLKPPT